MKLGKDLETGVPLAKEDGFFALAKAYGWIDADDDWLFVEAETSAYAEVPSGSLSLSPFHFVNVGIIAIDRGSLRYLGTTGFYRSATVAINNRSDFDLQTSGGRFRPAYVFPRRDGHILRCIAK